MKQMCSFTLKRELFCLNKEPNCSPPELNCKSQFIYYSKVPQPNTSIGESTSILGFLNDISKRNGKMDSLVSLTYDSENNPDLKDLYFMIPGKNECWLATRVNNLDLSIQRANEASINQLLLTNKILPA
jgi:hypothetical protein